MALPSAVTLGSLAIVAAAGAGLFVVAVGPDDGTRPSAATQPTITAPAPTTPTTPTTTTTTTKHPSADKHPPPAVPKILIDVYNNSGVEGLAAKQATFLQGAGWNVAATDNWYGDIPDNTVYFPPKRQADAAKLADVLGYSRLRPAVSPMQFDRLTVIITSP
jgi:hypothetical protein